MSRSPGKDQALETIAGWVAPIATMIAAMMTAANLGARVTGWGFVVFTVGSVCWSIVGIGTGQTNLVMTNIFLTVVNLVGIWRWLGRQRVYEEGGRTAACASRRAAAPTLFTATGIAGMPVQAPTGKALGTAVEALIECGSGRVSYVVVASGGGLSGMDEQLRAVPLERLTFQSDRLVMQLSGHAFEEWPVLDATDWPAEAPDLRKAA